jgi:RimJ/RimL family protein N-acetyltransferase
MTRNELSGSLRLLFEPLQALHAAELFERLSDPRVWEFIGENPYPSVAAVADHFDHMAAGPPARHGHERWINYAVRSRAQGILLGTLQATIVARRAEVAFLFGPQYWGRGYAAEAMTAFQEHLRHSAPIEEFWATTDPRNLRSIKLLGRLGYIEKSTSWPDLLSYEDGDLVFVLRCVGR